MKLHPHELKAWFERFVAEHYNEKLQRHDVPISTKTARMFDQLLTKEPLSRTKLRRMRAFAWRGQERVWDREDEFRGYNHGGSVYCHVGAMDIMLECIAQDKMEMKDAMKAVELFHADRQGTLDIHLSELARGVLESWNEGERDAFHLYYYGIRCPYNDHDIEP